MDINAKGFYTTPGLGAGVVRVFHGAEDKVQFVSVRGGRARSSRTAVKKHVLAEGGGEVTTTTYPVTELSLTDGQVVALQVQWKGRAPVRMTIACEVVRVGTQDHYYLHPLRADWEPNSEFDVLAPNRDVEVPFSRFSRI